jgi:hypothetical protein
MPALKDQRYELFAHEVAAFVPPADAYLSSGFKSKAEFARGNAVRLLREHPEVAARVDELREDYRARCALSLEYVQEQLRPLVEANVLDYFDRRRGTFKRPNRLRREQGLAISSVKLADDGRISEVKFHNKNEAAKALMTSLGIKDSETSNNLFLMNLGQRLTEALAQTAEDGSPVADAPARMLPQASVIDDEAVVEVIDL